MQRKVYALDYHRNGVGGAGFYVALIRDEDGSGKVAIRFPGPVGCDIPCAVLDTAMLTDDSTPPSKRIGFGLNSWRGDIYDGLVREAIEARIRRENATLGVDPDKAEEWSRSEIAHFFREA